jgi:transcriptional regulator with XRE-family HTH domain
MIKKEELIKTEEYWFETLQNEIYRMVADYLVKENMNQSQLAEKLGVSKGYISQIMNGNFNYTLKKLIELSLAVGKAPVLEFRALHEILKNTEKESTHFHELNKVAEPKAPYK